MLKEEIRRLHCNVFNKRFVSTVIIISSTEANEVEAFT